MKPMRPRGSFRHRKEESWHTLGLEDWSEERIADDDDAVALGQAVVAFLVLVIIICLLLLAWCFA